MLLHMRSFGDLPLDITDATGGFGVHVGGHAKWANAHNCMAFIALRGLERRGLVAWSGSSRALGQLGWHGGLWRLTEEGKETPP